MTKINLRNSQSIPHRDFGPSRIQARSALSGRIIEPMPVSKPSSKFKRLIPWVSAALLITTLAATYYYFKPCDVCSDITTPKAPLPPQYQPQSPQNDFCENIHTLKEFKGVPIKRIEDFLQQHNVFGGRSFVQKLEQDCKTVQATGTSNAELANHLESIIKKVKFAKDSYDAVPHSYNSALLEGSTIGRCSQMQLFEIEGPIISTGVMSENLRYNIFNEREFIGKNTYGVKNLKNNVKLLFTEIDIENVRNGFYDGFDPIRVEALLTGHSVDAIKNQFGLSEQNNESSSLSSIIDPTKTVMDPYFPKDGPTHQTPEETRCCPCG